MNTNKLKEKLKAGKPVFGSFISLNSLITSEIMARAGYDFLMVDFEHGSMSIETVGAQISAIKANGCVPLLRVPSLTSDNTKKGLDAGAYGLMYPMISTKSESENVVSWTAYPPRGTRGVGPVRANNFFANATEYFEFEKSEILRIVQIETKEAVENIDEILSVDGIDVAFIGPYDLSFSLGVNGDFENEKLKKAIDKVIAACKKHGVTCGIMTNDKQFKEHFEKGIRFFIYGVDALTLYNAAKAQVKMLRDLSEN